MSFLPVLEVRKSSAAFAFLAEQFGFVPKFFRAQTLRPALVEAEANAIGAILLKEAGLSRLQKEALLLAVSAANLNTYFVALHSQMLQLFAVPPEKSQQIAIDHHSADLSESDKALVDFALKLTKKPDEFGGEDVEWLRARGFADEQILEAIAMTGLTNFLNTVQMGLGVAPDFEPRLIFLPEEVNLFPQAQRPTTGCVAQTQEREDPDAEIVARVRAGDTDAFESLVRRHNRRIYRSLIGIVGRPEEAEDAMQDVFLKAFQKIGEFEGRSAFSTWLVRVAINTALQRVRGRKETESLDEGDDDEFRPRQLRAWGDNPEQAYSKDERRKLIESAVMGLPSKYRIVLMLRDLEELSTEEAAVALGLGIPALKARLLRGRLMLRESLAPYFSEGSTTNA